MPKKRSHGGEQEYIPAGNGLASGTYASDDGNNSYHTGGQNTDKVPPRHFKKFSKDNEKGETQTKPKEQETKPYVERKIRQLNGTEEEYEVEAYNKAIKTMKNLHTEKDEELEKVFSGSIVCFGKKMSPEKMDVIIDTCKRMKNDFPILDGNIKYLGGNSALGKYTTALNIATEITDEAIEKYKREHQDLINNRVEVWKKLGYNENEIEKRVDGLIQSRLTLSSYFFPQYDAEAYYSNSTKSIIYMPKGISRETSDIESSYKTNWWSSNAPNNTISHEMGHAVDYATQEYFQKVKTAVIYNVLSPIGAGGELIKLKSDFETNLNELYKQNKNTNFDVDIPNSKKYNISEYGNKNITEFVAESFSAYYGNMNNELANKVVNLYKDFINKLKGYE